MIGPIENDHRDLGLCIPGLLQTPDYARELHRAGRPGDAEEEIETLVATRMERKTVLTETNGPTLWVLVDEPVPRRPVGSPKIMRDQIGYLLEIADHPKVSIQAIPFDTGAHAGQTCCFILLALPGGMTVACVELAQLPRAIGVRDSKDPDGPKLVVARDTFAVLVAELKR
ncbi:DUF397 domain-containing protein [Actinomadura sp. 7K507]|uniref:DUF397 domain-containing protein n=1 Tax=Actinomadura sp. 7K507 TaxID=2530365 RepID=UPI001053DEDF|nr:DUF397 domain-containing protein [Actinomadura sp. 7K507]TDC98465.1 DUF397 domain-containing protein [Actinomadura sp. 7K507]